MMKQKKSRVLSFGLRGLFVLVLVIAAFLAGWASHLRFVQSRLVDLQLLNSSLVELTKALVEHRASIPTEQNKKLTPQDRSFLSDQERLEMLIEAVVQRHTQVSTELQAN